MSNIGLIDLTVLRRKKVIYGKSSCKSLSSSLNKTGGRSCSGRITVRHIGGGHKRKYRCIDFKRDKHHVVGVVDRIEYDPNRSPLIALIKYEDGDIRYILAPVDCKEGDKIVSGPDVEIKIGNAMPMIQMPVGSFIHNVELKNGKGGQLVRVAGGYAQIIGREDKDVLVRLRSGFVYKLDGKSYATIGILSNANHRNRNLVKAGRHRWLGTRPSVRGVVMNPVDHPHGGGEGRTSGGRHPCSPWGWQTKGFKTRSKKKKNPRVLYINKKKMN